MAWTSYGRARKLGRQVTEQHKAAAWAIRNGQPELARAHEDLAAQYGRLLDLELGTTPKVYRPRIEDP